MRHVQSFVGVGIIVGAVGMLAYNGTMLWHAAYGLNAKFPELAGWAAVGVLTVECLGLAVAGFLWGHKVRILAALAVIFTLAATIYTVRLEMNFQIAGTADLLEQRAANVSDNQLLAAELKTQRKIRDDLQDQKRLNNREALALKRARERIDTLEKQWRARIITADPSPEAAWLARNFGGTEETWTDRLAILPLFFWAIGRMVVMPIGLAVLALPLPAIRVEPVQEEREPVEPVKAEPDESKGADSDLTVEDPPPGEMKYKIVSEAAPEAVIRETPRRLGHMLRNIAAPLTRENSVKRFIESCVGHDEKADEKGRPVHLLASGAAYEAYKEWCSIYDVEPVAHPRFGVQFVETTGTAIKSLNRGSHYPGFFLREKGAWEAGQSAALPDMPLAPAA